MYPQQPLFYCECDLYMNKYAFFDVDYTIYNGYSTSDFYLFLVDHGICNTSIRTKDAELKKLYTSGKLDYTTASKRVVELQAKALQGLTVAEVRKLGGEFVKNSIKLFPFVKDLFKLLEANEFQLHLVSGSAFPSVQAIGEWLGIDNYFASELEIKSQFYTGKVTQMLNNEKKKHVLSRITNNEDKNVLTFGFGDSTGDVEMLSAVDHAFIINPHQEEVKQIAKRNRWNLVTNADVIPKVHQLLKSYL